MPIIDADAHVVESELTWEHTDGRDRRFTPATETHSGKQYWIIDGMRVRRDGNIGAETPRESREMRDIETRLRHMDRLGIDVQVLYPSLFLIPLTARPRVERALARSYNRWLADICRRGKSRLQWVAVAPTLNMENSLAEVRFAKDNGACGLFLRGGPHDAGRMNNRGPAAALGLVRALAHRLAPSLPAPDATLLSDPYFYPLYEEAGRLDLPICIHAATGGFAWRRSFARDSGFSRFKLPVISAFHSLAYHGIPEKFPNVRFGFIEAGAQWLPYVLLDLARRFRSKGKSLGKDFLRENRLYVACQTDDDLPYVLHHAGDDSLVIGSDYGHQDTAAELDALRRLKLNGEVSSAAMEKILSQNPKTLYGL